MADGQPTSNDGVLLAEDTEATTAPMLGTAGVDDPALPGIEMNAWEALEMKEGGAGDKTSSRGLSSHKTIEINVIEGKDLTKIDLGGKS